MKISIIMTSCLFAAASFLPAESTEMTTPDQAPEFSDEKAPGYRGIWYTLGQHSAYGDKYSGGLGTYTAYHNPIAIYSEEANKTFFVYGGAPDASERYLLCMAGVFDHETGKVQRPTIVFDKGALGVDDPHDNPAILIDNEGYLWVYVAGRNYSRDGILMKSTTPYSIDAFERVRVHPNMTYPQPWQGDDGVMFLFVKYGKGREIFLATSPDGYDWSPERKLVGFGGHYQVANYNRPLHKLGTYFNYHPGGNVDDRTNLYYMQSTDGGETWTSVDGEVLNTPLSDRKNPALVIDYEKDGILQYPCDLNWDAEGNPLMLYVTAFDHKPGPDGGPREVRLTRWNGEKWITSVVAETTHNYDTGSLYVDGSQWTVLFPSEAGPAQWGTGGEVVAWTSSDQGDTWTRLRTVTQDSPRNHSYVRRPVNAKAPFYGFWADGDTETQSISRLYFTNQDGSRVWRLPYTMESEWEAPEEMSHSE